MSLFNYYFEQAKEKDFKFESTQVGKEAIELSENKVYYEEPKFKTLVSCNTDEGKEVQVDVNKFIKIIKPSFTESLSEMKDLYNKTFKDGKVTLKQISFKNAKKKYA